MSILEVTKKQLSSKLAIAAHVMGRIAGVAGRFASLRSICLAFALSACALPAAAAPQDWRSLPTPNDAVDQAVEAFAIASTALGVAPGPAEKQLVKAIVRCAIANTSVLNCAREEAIARLPSDMRPIASCLVRGGSVEQCAASMALSPQLRDLLFCVARRQDLSNCVQYARSNAVPYEVRRTLGLIADLKADQSSELGQLGYGKIRNIIALAEGLRDKDWPKVSFYGGAEVYKVAVKIVLKVLLGGIPAIERVIGPIVDTVVQNRVDLVVNLVDALKANDKPRIGRLVVEFYLTAQVEMQCALFDALPEGSVTDAIREVTCGAIGQLIKAVGSLGSKSIAFAEDKVAAFLRSFDIDPTGIFGKSSCGTTASYYARNYAVCTKHSAFLALTNVPGSISPKPRVLEVEEALNNLCRKHFHPCNERLIALTKTTTTALNQVCNPQTQRFHKGVEDLVNGVTSMAAAFAKENFEVSTTASEVRNCMTSSALRNFVPRCVRALSAQMPGLTTSSWQQCGASHPAWNLPRPDIFDAACSQAACSADTVKWASCRTYAASALDVRRRAHERQCDPKGLSGPQWSPRFEDHFEWCMAAPRGARINENNARENALFRCELVSRPYPKFEERDPIAPFTPSYPEIEDRFPVAPPQLSPPLEQPTPFAGPETIGPRMENNTNRAFSDYHRFELDGRTPEVCQNACRNDAENCRAWAYVRPGVQGPKALCYLKNAVPPAVPDRCCISGVEPKRFDRFRQGGGIAPQRNDVRTQKR